MTAWKLESTPTLIRRLALPHGNYFGTRLSESVWFSGWHHFVATFRVDFEGEGAAQEVASLWTEAIHGLERIPSLDRAMVEVMGDPNGIPLFEISTGRFVKYATGSEPGRYEGDLRSSYAVAADASRELFYVTAKDSTGAAGLFAVDALTGEVMARRPFTGLKPWEGNDTEVTYDPLRDLLYVGVPALEKLLVIEPESFEEIGAISLEELLPVTWWDSKIVLGQDEGMAYYVFTDTWQEGTPAILFRLLPNGTPSG